MSMAVRDGFIWLDGELVPWQEAKVHVLTHTLHYGMGVFEGVRAYETAKGPAIFRMKEHTDRLFNSAHIMNMKIPFSKDEVNAAQIAAVKENNLPHAYLRPMAFYGSEGMGLRAHNLKVHLMVAAWEWPAYMSPEALELGIKVRTSSYTRHHVNITMCKAKANGKYNSENCSHFLVLSLQPVRGCPTSPPGGRRGILPEATGKSGGRRGCCLAFSAPSRVVPPLLPLLAGHIGAEVRRQIHCARAHGPEGDAHQDDDAGGQNDPVDGYGTGVIAEESL